MSRWLPVAGILVAMLAGAALEAVAEGGERLPLALKVTIEEAWTGDRVGAAFVLVNSGPLSIGDVSVRVCLPPGWSWGDGSASAALPLTPPWKLAPDDLSSCRRFLLGAVPGRREREFALDLVRWPPLAWEDDAFHAGVVDAPVLDVSVFGAPRPEEPAELVLRRSYELRIGAWSQPGDLPSGEEDGGRPGARWNSAGDAGWGAVSAELQAARAWEGGLLSAFGSASSLEWASSEGRARIGSQSNAVEFDWHRGPARVVALNGVRPTLPAESAWSFGARASGETPAGGAVSGRLGVGRAEGDIWSCRLAEAALEWEREGAGAALSIAEAANTTINTRGPQERRAALAQLEASSQVRLGGTPWSVRGVLARGVPRTLTPSCGLSPEEGWRLRLLAERAGPGVFNAVTWTAAWPLEPGAERPFTHEVAAALSIDVARDVAVEVEPALRLAAGGEESLALRVQAGVGSLHRLRLELGPEALTPASELPRAGEGDGRLLVGWEVPRGSVRPRFTYESERLAGGMQHELRGGLTLFGSVRVPWSGRERAEGSVRLAREQSWGVKGESYENLFALRLGRRPSTARAEWTWTAGERRVSLIVEHEPRNPAAPVERVRLSAEQRVEDAGPARRLEGAVAGRWARGRWGGALAYAISPAPAGREGSLEGLGATGGAAARAFATWELGRWQLKGEWAESAHTQEPPGFARRVELQVKRWMGEALSVGVRGGYCWSGSEQAPCPPEVALEWLPPFAGGGAVVALRLEFPAGGARVALSASAPLSW